MGPLRNKIGRENKNASLHLLCTSTNHNARQIRNPFRPRLTGDRRQERQGAARAFCGVWDPTIAHPHPIRVVGRTCDVSLQRNRVCREPRCLICASQARLLVACIATREFSTDARQAIRCCCCCADPCAPRGFQQSKWKRKWNGRVRVRLQLLLSLKIRHISRLASTLLPQLQSTIHIRHLISAGETASTAQKQNQKIRNSTCVPISHSSPHLKFCSRLENKIIIKKKKKEKSAF